MDILSSRFQRALTDRITKARVEKTENLATTARMATSLETIKFEAGILQGYTEVMQMVEEIEQQMNTEAKG